MARVISALVLGAVYRAASDVDAGTMVAFRFGDPSPRAAASPPPVPGWLATSAFAATILLLGLVATALIRGESASE